MPFDGLQLGNYRLLRLIGSGGMGEVYVAEDIRTPRQLAVKIARIEPQPFEQDDTFSEMKRLFHREMQVVIALDHPNILPLIDFGEMAYQQESTLLYIVMPYRPEGSLSNWLIRQHITTALPFQDATHMILQAADALQHAHDHQIVHQDVKLANFLVREYSNRPHQPDLLLTDFGIARITTSGTTQSVQFRGTPAAMPPEQWDGKPVPASDQYALAVMAYQLLTGRAPFVGGMQQIMRQHFTKQPDPPGQLNPLLPAGVDDVLLRALAKSPEQRYPSILTFAQELQQLAEASSAYLPAAVPSTNSTPVISAHPTASTPVALESSPVTPAEVMETQPLSQTPGNPTISQVPTSFLPGKQKTLIQKPQMRTLVLALLALLLIIPAGIVATTQIQQRQLQAEQATTQAAIQNTSLALRHGTSTVVTATSTAHTPKTTATADSLAPNSTATTIAFNATATSIAVNATASASAANATATTEAANAAATTVAVNAAATATAQTAAACYQQDRSLGPYTLTPNVYLLPPQTPWFSSSSSCQKINIKFTQLTAPVQMQVCFTDTNCNAWVDTSSPNQWYTLATNVPGQTTYRFGIKTTQNTTLQFIVAD